MSSTHPHRRTAGIPGSFDAAERPSSSRDESVDIVAILARAERAGIDPVRVALALGVAPDEHRQQRATRPR